MNLRVGLDIILLANLLLLMAYPIFDLSIHMYGGIVFFLLLIYHHWLNRRWGKGLSRGRWTGWRMIETAVNVGLGIVFLLLLYSGLFFMQRSFSFSVLPGTMAIAQGVHLWSAYAGFLLVACHMGLHGQLFLSLFRKWTGNRKWMVKGISYLLALLTLYGLWAFVHNQWLDYLLIRTHFVFFDFAVEPISFFAEHIAILVGFAWLVWKGRSGR